jgi:hypothetical protein
MATQALQKVDHAALKANQVTIILLNILAFVTNMPWLAVLVAVAMLTGVLRKAPGFSFIYKYGLKPLKWVKPDILDDNPEPHRFAQLLGGVFMSVGSGALYLGVPGLGWGLVWLVVALAALNAFGGFCVGCAVYYWLNRLNVLGFTRQPPSGTIPGMRPKGITHES